MISFAPRREEPRRKMVESAFKEMTCEAARSPFGDLKNFSGESVLHLSSKNNHYEMTRLMLDAGMDPDVRTPEGRTPLHYACAEGHAMIVEMLLNKGSDPEIADKWGNTPLSEAFKTESKKTVRILLQAGAKIPPIDEAGQRLLELCQIEDSILAMKESSAAPPSR